MATETPLLGFDIGSTAVRACLLTGDERRPELVVFDTLELQPGTVVNGVIRDADAIVDALRELVERNEVEGIPAAVAVPASTSYLRRETLAPRRGRYDLRAAHAAVEEEIPPAWGEVSISVTPLSELDEDDVLIVAAPRLAVEALRATFGVAGIPLLCVDSANCALYNAVAHAEGMESSAAVALVDIGAIETRVVLLDGYAMVGSMRLPTGGAELTALLRRELSLGYVEAETYKIGGSDGSSDGVVPRDVQDALERGCGELAGQVATGLRGLCAAARVKRLEGVYLTGRSAALSMLRSSMGAACGVRVRGIAPFGAAEVDSNEFARDFLQALEPSSAVAFGLALRRSGL